MSLSRIGKKPIPIPKGVEVVIDGLVVRVKGKLGELEQSLKGVVIERQGDEIVLTQADGSRSSKALHGLSRTLVANMVEGVSQGFKRGLQIAGVGYRAEVAGDVLTLHLGYSHPVVYKMPEGIKVSVEKQVSLTLEGIDKELLGRTAAKVRSFRAPEPYKGKGIKYVDETIIRKVGKSA